MGRDEHTQVRRRCNSVPELEWLWEVVGSTDEGSPGGYIVGGQGRQGRSRSAGSRNSSPQKRRAPGPISRLDSVPFGGWTELTAGAWYHHHHHHGLRSFPLISTDDRSHVQSVILPCSSPVDYSLAYCNDAALFLPDITHLPLAANLTVHSICSASARPPLF